MPAFNPKAVERIRNVVKYVEGNVPGLTKQAPRQVESLPWNWWVLTEDLDSDTHEAAANPLEWYVSRNDGDGEYSQDISTFKVRDTLENSGAVAGDIVLCRPIGSENGTVLEIVLPRSEPRLAWATTTGDGDISSVTGVEPWDGSEWSGDDPLSVDNPLAWNDNESALKCLIGYNAGEEAWQVIVLNVESEAEQITVVTAFQINEENMTVQYKKRTVKAFDPGDETGWTTAHTGTDECP